MEQFHDIAVLAGETAVIATTLTLLVGVGWKAWRFIYKTAKYAEHVHETVGRVDALVEKQLTNNGGESLLDMVTETRYLVRNLNDRVTALEDK